MSARNIFKFDLEGHGLLLNFCSVVMSGRGAPARTGATQQGRVVASSSGSSHAQPGRRLQGKVPAHEGWRHSQADIEP